MEIRNFIKLVTLTLGFTFLSLFITTETQAQTTDQSNFSCTSVREIPQIECTALVSIYNRTNGPSWVNKNGWLATDTPCNWYGVTCSGGSVTEINLNLDKQGNGLSGHLPDSIKHFTNLINLALGNNQLKSIPTEIGELSNLIELRLNANQLSSLPTTIGALSKLTALSLSDNQLSSVPVEIGNLSNLITLTLWHNDLTSLPASIGNLSKLEGLYLSSNRLKNLPAEIGNLSNLTQLYIDANQLSSIPAKVSSLSNLTIFHFGYNRITNMPPGREDDTTQTIAPTNLTVNPLSENAIKLTWDPIVFVAQNGAYEISVRNIDDSTDSFTVHGLTQNKSTKSYTINGLARGTNYSFRVRAHTFAHDGADASPGAIWDDQRSALWSDYSEIVSGHTKGPAPTTPTASPTSTFTPTSTDTPTRTPTPTDTSTSTPSPTSTSTNTATPIVITPTREQATPAGPVCYRLTFSRTGSGQVPAVSPNRSRGCAKKHYTANESIQITAQPAVDWIIQSWGGTVDDKHKGNINNLIMPDSDHTVTVVYTELPKLFDEEPLAVSCNSTTPVGDERHIACLVGMVYFNGEPAENIEVTIANSDGESVIIPTRRRVDRAEKRPYYLFELNSDPLSIKVGQAFNIEVSHNGIPKRLTSLVAQAGHQQIDIILPSSKRGRPIATINHLPNTSFDKDDRLIADGMGEVQYSESKIQAYRWMSDRSDEPLSNAQKLDYYVRDLEHGSHQLSFQVQDDRGIWSNPVKQEIYVSNQPLAKWTMLLYLAANYHTDGDAQLKRFNETLTQIGMYVNNPDLRVAALLDGYNRPAELVAIEPGPQKPQIFREENANLEEMDDPNTLVEFIKWGQDKYPAEHYYLVIADHGQGIQGIVWDSDSDNLDDGKMNDSAYLTVSELEDALTAPDVDAINVLHLDACSMNLLETAYEVRNTVTDVLISSQYLGWNFFPYRRYADLIDGDTTPLELGKGIVREYGTLAIQDEKPYTLSALDMKHSSAVLDALDELAKVLTQRLLDDKFNRQILSKTREDAQSFHSGFDDELKSVYLYIDIRHWATLLRENTSDFELDEKAADLIQEIDRFIIAEQSDSGLHGGSRVDLDNSSGISIFYPERFNYINYQSYIKDELFEFTKYSQWVDFLEAHPKTLGPGTPMLSAPGPLAHLEIDDSASDDSASDDSASDDSASDDSASDDSASDDSANDDSANDDSASDDSANDDSASDDSASDDSASDDSASDDSASDDSASDDSASDDSASDDSASNDSANDIPPTKVETPRNGETVLFLPIIQR